MSTNKIDVNQQNRYTNYYPDGISLLEDKFNKEIQKKNQEIRILNNKINILTKTCISQQEDMVKLAELQIIDKVHKPVALTGASLSGVLAGVFGFAFSPLFAMPFLLSMGFSLCYWKYQDSKS